MISTSDPGLLQACKLGPLLAMKKTASAPTPQSTPACWVLIQTARGAAAQRVSVVRRWSVSVQIGWRLASGFFDRVERRKTGEQRVPVLQVAPGPAHKLPS